MIPISIQQLFIAGMQMIDNLMVGQIHETAVTAASLSYQVYFIIGLIYFGINSGSMIFTAQYWGKNDTNSIRKVVSINLFINIAVGLLFTLLAEFFPHQILSLYTNDPAVIESGAPFLRVYATGYIFTGISMGLYGVLRSTQRVKIPMVVNSLALIFNTSLGYLLIFGKFGLPEMGIMGAAYANALSRVVEFTIILIILWFGKSFLLHDRGNLFPIPKEFVFRFLKTTLPVAMNEFAWAMGISAYNSIYAHIGTEAAASTSIATTLENLMFVPFIGLGNACAILIGNQIGANMIDVAFRTAKRTLMVCVGAGLMMGLLFFILKDSFVPLYHVSETTKQYSLTIISFYAFILTIKAWNMVIYIGILRAGGDTKFALIAELSTMWLYGVPAAWIGANLFHLPIYWVVPIALSEEILKSFIAFSRYHSKKWVHHLAQAIAG